MNAHEQTDATRYVEPIPCTYAEGTDCCRLCGGTLGMWPDKCAECREHAIAEHARSPAAQEVACPDCGGTGERAWLVERRSSGVPEWLYVHNEFFQWTRDSLLAIRFCRREDADQVAAVIGEDAEYVTEHQWGP